VLRPVPAAAARPARPHPRAPARVRGDDAGPAPALQAELGTLAEDVPHRARRRPPALAADDPRAAPRRPRAVEAGARAAPLRCREKPFASKARILGRMREAGWLASTRLAMRARSS